jgi:hypothetical protein
MSRVIISEKSCAHCARVFAKDTRNTWAYWAKAKYCSQSCAGAAHSAESALKRPPMREAFFSHVKIQDGCWPWLAALDKDGYGIFSYERKTYRAHVISLKLDGRPTTKERPFGCHTCDNPVCVNPCHLYPGTPMDNVQDAVSRDRHMRGERSVHAKLVDGDIMEIRRSRLNDTDLADAYGVTSSNITMIRLRKTWKHLP